MRSMRCSRAAATSPAEVTTEVKEFSKKLDDLKEKFKGGWGGARFSIFDLAGQLQASTSAPTDAQMRSLDQITTKLTTQVGRAQCVHVARRPGAA